MKFKENQKVELFGLENTPQFNGKKGKVIDYEEDQTAYVIDIEGVGEVVLEEKNLKWIGEPVADEDKKDGVESSELPVDWSKLEFKKDDAIEIVDLENAPQYNGKKGKVIDFDEEDEAYVCEIDGLGEVQLNKENLKKVVE